MTTTKHALGYNIDGTLGVAGLIPRTEPAGSPGILLWPYGFGSLGPALFASSLDDLTFEQSTDTVPSMSYSTGTESSAGNGIIVVALNPMYGQLGRSLIQYTSDGITFDEVDSINGKSFIYQGGYEMYGITISFIGGRFWVSWVENSGMTYKYATTTDFVTFSDTHTAPFYTMGQYGIYKTSDGRTVVPTDYGVAISSDDITWSLTSPSFWVTNRPNPLRLVSPNYGFLNGDTTLSDGRKLVAAYDVFSSQAVIVFIPEDKEIGDLFVNSAFATSQMVYGGYFYGFRGKIIDGDTLVFTQQSYPQDYLSYTSIDDSTGVFGGVFGFTFGNGGRYELHDLNGDVFVTNSSWFGGVPLTIHSVTKSSTGVVSTELAGTPGANSYIIFS